MRKTIILKENKLKQMISKSIKNVLNEIYMSGGFEQIDLDGSASYDFEGGKMSAANLWFQNDTIVVRWVDNNGADSTSDLLDDDPEMIWSIIKSIKN